MSHLLPEGIEHYLEQIVPEHSAVLQRMEQRAADTGFPIIGPACGALCALVTRLTGARHVFELGSGFGYSTAWFADAVAENGDGRVDHVVWDEALSQEAQRDLAELGHAERVRYTVDEAVAALKRSEGPFDLIFNDIDKHAYAEALPVIERKLAPGGVLIMDNMLWHGKVLAPQQHTDADTRGVREATRHLTASPHWDLSLVPIRDGLGIARWRG